MYSNNVAMENIIKLLPLDIESYSRILDIHEKMKWVFVDIVYNSTITCFNCDKRIIKNVYSYRSRYCFRSYVVNCSIH